MKRMTGQMITVLVTFGLVLAVSVGALAALVYSLPIHGEIEPGLTALWLEVYNSLNEMMAWFCWRLTHLVVE